MDYQTITPTNGILETAFKDNQEGEFANKILRGELSAVESYNHVIKKYAEEESISVLNVLRRIRDEHEYACVKLRQVVKSEGAIPSEESGPWGGFVAALLRTASLTGENGAIRLLRTGEEHGLNLYEEALDLKLSQEEINLIREVLIPKQESHILALDQLLERDQKVSH